MKTFIGAALAAVLSLSAGSAGAAHAPLMRVLIKPGAMSETVGKGDLDVTMTIPAVNVAAGVPLLSLSTMIPGASKPQTVNGLMPDSEAAKAGLREGDKVNFSAGLDSIQGDVRRRLTLQVTRDGNTFPITYLPRGKEVDAYQWERIPGAPDDACKATVGSPPKAAK